MSTLQVSNITGSPTSALGAVNASSIAVTGTMTQNGAATFSNTIVVTGNATFSNTVTVSASGITFSDATVQTSKALSGFSNMQVFTANGTFTVPAGVTRVKVFVTGAGGGGGYQAGGAGGGTAIKYVTGLTPGATITVTVGLGGSAGSNYPGTAYGGTGGTTSFGAYCSATGGSGGPPYNGPPSGRAPGVGSGGDLNLYGGVSADYDSGSGVNSGPGGGTYWTPTASLNSTVGVLGYGVGGGAGESSSFNLTAGNAGVVVVEY